GAATVLASPRALCVSGSATITLTPSGPYAANTIQWQSSLNNTSFTDISGANANTYTASPSATTYYRVQIKDGTGAVCFSTVADSVVVNNPQILSTTPATVCGIGAATLCATASNGSAISWYANSTGGLPLTGPSSAV